MTLAVLAAVLAALPAAASDPVVALPAPDAPGLNLADLGPYRAALDGKPAGEAAPVAFRELWEEPGRYTGRRVRVEGRVLRRFRQGAFGTFPALVEAWAVSPPGDPFCLVFPDPNPGAPPKSAAADAAPGASVRFEGVFLRSIRYQGGDVPRLAPLVVGDRPPSVTSPAPERVRLDGPGGPPVGPRSWWTFGFVTAGLLAVVLARRHFRAPFRRPRREDDPPPEFLDPDPSDVE